ncbi:unnamed protein product [Arabis nemorensis]|uniref:Uncharacterized protein n=1 Tax=Arabis nemorensis TaxID=586526 RepID=A0A565BWZ1_9BRAS|nr:unnamed protein product [Arabis nemorensis]
MIVVIPVFIGRVIDNRAIYDIPPDNLEISNDHLLVVVRTEANNGRFYFEAEDVYGKG